MSYLETVKYDQLLLECDLLIKAGKINSVVSAISKVNLTQVPRSHKQSMAKLFRRAGLINHGIRLLYPVIRAEKQLVEAPTASEICEYAALISRIGSIKESLELLKNINPLTNPEALLYSGFCHVSNWNYVEARRFFEHYLTLQVDDYSKLIAKVNLAACYVGAGDLLSAKLLIGESLELACQAKSARLQGNLLELRGQMNVFGGNFSEAKKDLKLAEQIFLSSQTYDALLTEKWQSIIAAFETKSTEPLALFRKNAEKQKHWESVRESDLFSVIISFDQNLFDRLIFGTPSGAYQKRACELVKYESSETLIWGQASGKSINLADCSGESAGEKLPQMLLALLKDFYAPRSVVSLFSEVYPDEYFNIDSSPCRIRQNVKRLRHWLAERSYNAEISYERGGYRFVAKEGFSLILNRNLNQGSLSIERVFFARLERHFAKRGFTVSQACDFLKISESRFHRLARSWLGSGLFARTGRARATSYCIKN